MVPGLSGEISRTINETLTPPPAMFRLGEGWVRIFSDTEDIGLYVTGERQTSIVVRRRWN